MLSIHVSSKKIIDQKSSVYGFLVPDSFSSSILKPVEALLDIDMTAVLKKLDFQAKAGQTVSFPVQKGKTSHRVILVGLGTPKNKRIAIEQARRSVAALYKAAAGAKESSVVIEIPAASLFGVSAKELAQQLTIALQMAAYRFDKFFSDKEKTADTVKVVTLCVDAKSEKDFNAGAKDGMVIAQAVNKARHWVDMPPSQLTPVDLADKAKKIAKEHGLKITVFDEKEVIKNGMGGLAGVSRGSENDCQLVILEYKARKKNAPTIAFVGKGITFDSGGLSLKPPVHMETMKEDMSGAAAVIATMEALAQLKPDVNVIGVTPLAENLPSGKATKPGDILKFYNGKTAEVKNTDAEGRLILADALAYATKHYKPDAIIDIATLTGACAYSLGPFFSGLLSQHDELVDAVNKSAERSGDHVWRLPLTDDYEIAVKSEVADLCNIGANKYMAGATTAGFFLKPFVGDTPWVHLDIAGTAFNVPDRPYYKTGATGVGVRLLIDVAMHWKS